MRVHYEVLATFLVLLIVTTGQKLDCEHLVFKKVKFIIVMSSVQEHGVMEKKIQRRIKVSSIRL